MIVTKNTFVSYSLARGTAQFQLILLIFSLYTVIVLPGGIPSENLDGLSESKFKMCTLVLIPLLVASLLLVNVLTDFLGYESMKYSASIIGLCIEFMLFAIVVNCQLAIKDSFIDFTSFCYFYWLLILEVSIIGQIVSGVIFMMIRGLVHSKVQLRAIPETKSLLETDALTTNKEEISLFSSFLIPFLVTIEVPTFSDSEVKMW
jgi:hypothetical protein